MIAKWLGKNQWVTVVCGYKLCRKGIQGMKTGEIFIHKNDSESEITLLRYYRAEHPWPKNTKSYKLKTQACYPISAVKQDADCMIERKAD